MNLLRDLLPDPEPPEDEEPDPEPEADADLVRTSRSGTRYRRIGFHPGSGDTVIAGPKPNSPGWSYVGILEAEIFVNLKGDDAWRTVALDEAVEILPDWTPEGEGGAEGSQP